MTATGPVMIMAGGTGGHIFPGLAVAAALRAQGIAVIWLGAEGGMETRLVAEQGLRLYTLAVRGVRGKALGVRLQAPWMLLRTLLAAVRVLRATRPRSVLSMGGYVAGPGGLAAFLMRIPLLVHEQNALPGMTNRVLARLARRVLGGFADALPGLEWVGNPVRAEITKLDPPAERFRGRGVPRLLILGGSQGAKVLNRRVPEALLCLDRLQRPEVWHQCGESDLDATRRAYRRHGIKARVEPFIVDMAAAYAWADLALCRAGALTLAELAAVGLGAVLVPYPYAVDDHQTRNAVAMVDAGAALLCQESQCAASILAGHLQALLSDAHARLQMAESARVLARPQAAQTIAQRCLEEAV